MTLINGTALNTTSSRLLVSNFEKPIVLTMIGSAALTNTIQSSEVVNGIINGNDSQSNLTPIQADLNPLAADTLCYRNSNSNQECVLSVINEETQMDSNLLSRTMQSDSQLNPTFNTIPEVAFDKISQDNQTNAVSNNVNDFKSESLVVNSNTSDVMPEPVSLPESQYLPLNSFNSIPSSNHSIILNSTLESAVSSSPLTDIPQMPIACDPITNLLEQIPPNQLIPTPMSVINSEPVLSLANSNEIQPKPVSVDPIPIKSIISDNPVLESSVTTAPVTQASNISTLSEMSDAELLCFINPAAFDQM